VAHPRDREAHFSTSPRTNARWNAEREAVKFGVGIGEYRGVVTPPYRLVAVFGPIVLSQSLRIAAESLSCP
jgi:hypothetical protein